MYSKWLLADQCISVPPCYCSRGLVGRHIAQAQLMQSCLAAVKTSMLVVQRSPEIIGAALPADQDHCTLQNTLSSLFGCYTHILTDGKKQASKSPLSCAESQLIDTHN